MLNLMSNLFGYTKTSTIRNLPQIPTELWCHIFTFLEPILQHKHLEQSNISMVLSFLKQNGQLNQWIYDDSFRNTLVEWNVARQQCSVFYQVVRTSFTVLDLGVMFHHEQDFIDEICDKLNPFKCSKYPGFKWNFMSDEELVNHNRQISKVFEKQDLDITYLNRGIGDGFTNIQTLILDNWYRLRDDQLQEMTGKLVNLKSLSVINCRNVKQLKILSKLEKVSIHVHQIDLRVNLLEQRFFSINVVEGIDYIYFKGLSGKTIPLEYSNRYKISDLKRIVAPYFDTSANLRLAFAGKELQDDIFIPDYSIQSESTLHVVLSSKN